VNILDALGNVLERRVSVIKIDVVLGIRFIDEVHDYTRVDLIAHYLSKHNVTLYCHDFERAEHIRRLHQMHIFDHVKSMSTSTTYFADTLSVMYEWIGRHKYVYCTDQRKDAYRLFVLLCESYRCTSVLNLKEDLREFMFNYIYSRDFIDHNLSI
jgi:hypothetical protein